MKILVIIALVLMSFGTQEEKKVTLTFTVEEVQLVYDALGNLPANKVEALRAKIVLEANRQLSDTTTKKK